ncbi:hypothetical protein DM01DRAFT_1331884 [Hesseltinella vesiculosa]|uniref:DUF1764-domain-containing protein n=1 Tax=Hesseltinella vesiculosa TaxID=101127 RepID=A0A1X2GWQ3_9FUNG|nr:hypothetical protein DM01DRAFT_1331884 [Hesseltinella vesiculosa]
MAKKKNTSSTKKNEPVKPAESQKPAATTDEIDDIFASKGSKKESKQDAPKDQTQDNDTKDNADDGKVEEVVFAELAAVKSLKRKQPSAPSPEANTSIATDDTFADSRGKKAKRLTDDGYPLYDVKDLRIGEGEDTPDCPFDCQCCF